ncbi:MAG: M15 family metallopeptidase [Actinomycetota bacterium]
MRRVAAAAALALAPAAAGAASFTAMVRPLSAAQRAAMTPSVWRPGCPVGLGDLRAVRMRHWGFDGRVRTGTLVVHRDAAAVVVTVFRRLFAARFPIRRMVPIEAYGGSDFRSIEADNTSAFNCRAATGSRRWSQHAYGRAIDVNPIENPYVEPGGRVYHVASRRYVDRTPRPGMAVEGEVLVRAFDAAGWSWGGRWSGVRDYQHFSASGG